MAISCLGETEACREVELQWAVVWLCQLTAGRWNKESTLQSLLSGALKVGGRKGPRGRGVCVCVSVCMSVCMSVCLVYRDIIKVECRVICSLMGHHNR